LGLAGVRDFLNRENMLFHNRFEVIRAKENCIPSVAQAGCEMTDKQKPGDDPGLLLFHTMS
jgi:hypothetical protein